jgi:hypothetical protein
MESTRQMIVKEVIQIATANIPILTRGQCPLLINDHFSQQGILSEKLISGFI